MTTQSELSKNYSGIFGNQVVLKNRRGRSVITIPPARPKKAPTVKQSAARERLRLAAAYAARAMQDPVLQAEYAAKARKGRSAYHLALIDFLRSPFILQADTSGYHGNKGDKITISAGDDFKLVSVTLKISSHDGTLVEEGDCVISMPSGQYVYAAREQLPSTDGVVILVRATDLPGNVTEKSVTL
ncbi:MAG: hypothetical protein NTW10_02910 [Bacteroidetes bacterium]|nr:hypothetical protein [Bacteroidota bacterium]